MKSWIEKIKIKSKYVFLMLMVCMGVISYKQFVFANSDPAISQLPPGPKITAEYIVEKNQGYIDVNCSSWAYNIDTTYREYEVSTDGVNFDRTEQDTGFEFDHCKIPITEYSRKVSTTYYIRVRAIGPIKYCGKSYEESDYSDVVQLKVADPVDIKIAPDSIKKNKVALGSSNVFTSDLTFWDSVSPEYSDTPVEWGVVAKRGDYDWTWDEEDIRWAVAGGWGSSTIDGCTISNEGVLNIAKDKSLIGKEILVYCKLPYDKDADNRLPYGYKMITIAAKADKIELESNIELEKGEKTTIKAIGLPNKITRTNTWVCSSIVWSSGNEKVATVNQEGVVKAVGYGKTTIRATAANGKYITVKFRVIKPKLSSKKVTLLVGEPDEVWVDNVNNKISKAKWKVKNPKIVKIIKTNKKENSIEFIGLKPGKTQIAVEVDGIVLICNVTIKKPTFKLKKITIEVGNDEYNPIRGEDDIEAKIKWKSSNKKVAAVSSDGTVTAKKRGKAKITATIKSCKISYWVIVK